MISKKEEIKRLEEEIEQEREFRDKAESSLVLASQAHDEQKRINAIQADEIERKTRLLEESMEQSRGLKLSLEAKEGLTWHKGEPKESGWYLVRWKPMPLADKKTEALHYNPLGRCRWMRGEKGNAERFDGVVYEYAVIV